MGVDGARQREDFYRERALVRPKAGMRSLKAERSEKGASPCDSPAKFYGSDHGRHAGAARSSNPFVEREAGGGNRGFRRSGALVPTGDSRRPRSRSTRGSRCSKGRTLCNSGVRRRCRIQNTPAPPRETLNEDSAIVYRTLNAPFSFPDSLRAKPVHVETAVLLCCGRPEVELPAQETLRHLGRHSDGCRDSF